MWRKWAEGCGRREKMVDIDDQNDTNKKWEEERDEQDDISWQLRAECGEKKWCPQMTQMTQIKNENRYGMNRIFRILGILFV